jgi:hypothetical protein
MVIRFDLCTECQEKYSQLQYDPTATYGLNVVPLCSLEWEDEHPSGGMPRSYGSDHQNCRDSIVRLAGARTYLWRNGSLPEDCQELWTEAQRVIPNWPGFKRLILDEEQRRSLDGCAEELDELIGRVGRDFSEMSLTDKGGGIVELSAQRKAEGRSLKPWWRFWGIDQSA